jgi:hypothetical protein
MFASLFSFNASQYRIAARFCVFFSLNASLYRIAARFCVCFQFRCNCSTRLPPTPLQRSPPSCCFHRLAPKRCSVPCRWLQIRVSPPLPRTVTHPLATHIRTQPLAAAISCKTSCTWHASANAPSGDSSLPDLATVPDSSLVTRHSSLVTRHSSTRPI